MESDLKVNGQAMQIWERPQERVHVRIVVWTGANRPHENLGSANDRVVADQRIARVLDTAEEMLS